MTAHLLTVYCHSLRDFELHAAASNIMPSVPHNRPLWRVEKSPASNKIEQSHQVSQVQFLKAIMKKFEVIPSNRSSPYQMSLTPSSLALKSRLPLFFSSHPKVIKGHQRSSFCIVNMSNNSDCKCSGCSSAYILQSLDEVILHLSQICASVPHRAAMTSGL